jgi:hypothetical protein
VLKTRGTTDEHGWTLIEDGKEEDKPQIYADWRRLKEGYAEKRNHGIH